MAKRRVFYGEVAGLDNYIERLRELDGDLKTVIGEAMEQAADDSTADTIAAMKKQHLPAGGKYSTGETEKTIIRNPKAEWRGSVGSIGLGFDKAENGVGTLLISGTPRMKPDEKLARIYTRKQTAKEFYKVVIEAMENAIEELGG